MRRNAGIGAEHDGDTVGIGGSEGALDQWPNGSGFRTYEIREEAINFGFFRNPVAGKNGWHVNGATLLHQAHDLAVHVGTVLNGGDTGDDGAFHAFGAVCVRGDAQAVVGSSIHDGLEFIVRELRVLAALGHAENAAGGGNFYPVCTVFVALPDGPARVFDTVDDAITRTAGIAQEVMGPAIGRISVTSGRGQRLAGGQYLRADDIAGVDRFAQGNGDIECVTEISYHSKSCFQGKARILRGIERIIGFVHDETL